MNVEKKKQKGKNSDDDSDGTIRKTVKKRSIIEKVERQLLYLSSITV